MIDNGGGHRILRTKPKCHAEPRKRLRRYRKFANSEIGDTEEEDDRGHRAQNIWRGIKGGGPRQFHNAEVAGTAGWFETPLDCTMHREALWEYTWDAGIARCCICRTLHRACIPVREAEEKKAEKRSDDFLNNICSLV